MRIPVGAWATALAVGAIMAATALPPDAQAQSGSRMVKCRVQSAGNPVYTGSCRFNPAGGGSFVLEHSSEGRSLTGPILTVSVNIVKGDVAEVRGLTKSGVNSRWGEARRSGSDRSCWVGSDFRVCAW